MSSDMDEHDLTAWLTKEQNVMDHLTRKIYGPHAKFEKLSAFGQNTIEGLARDRAMISDPDPEMRSVMARNIDLERENSEISKRLAVALQENQDLWEENQEYRMREVESEEDSSSGRTRHR